MTVETKTYPPIPLDAAPIPEWWTQVAVGEDVCAGSGNYLNWVPDRGKWMYVYIDLYEGHKCRPYEVLIRRMTPEEICAEVAEECCRVVCPFCRNNRSVILAVTGWWYHLIEGQERGCHANEIRQHFYLKGKQ